MTHYHAVMLDECGGEFGKGVEAESYDAAMEILMEDYPESQVIQLESPQDTADREARIYRQACIDNGDDDFDDYDDEDDEEDAE